MASSHRLFKFCNTSFMIFLYLVSLSSSQKVTLSLYYESLCPFSADFIVNYLPKLFENGLISTVDLRFIPWGNAVKKPDGSIVCQHGEAECKLNKIQSCAINMYPDVVKHFGYIYCTERLVLEDKLYEWAACLDMAGLSRAVIGCYFSGYGDQLQQRYAKETSELNPARTYVPWVVINNQPLLEDFQNFEFHVCNAYGVNQAPEACKNLNRSAETLSRFDNSVEKLSNSPKVCYSKSLNP